MQEGGPQRGLPQALVRCGQQCRSPWWLEVVEGGLGWGHPSLGLGEQSKQLRKAPSGEPPAHYVASSCFREYLIQQLAGRRVSLFKGILAKDPKQRGPVCLKPSVGLYSQPLIKENLPPTRQQGWSHEGWEPGLLFTHTHKSHRWWVEEEAPQLRVGPRVLGPKDGSRRWGAGGHSRRALGSPWRGLGSTLGLGLPRGRRGPHSALRLWLWRAELELAGEMGVRAKVESRPLGRCGPVWTAFSGASPALALTPQALSSPDSARVLPGPPEWGPAQEAPAVSPSV